MGSLALRACDDSALQRGETRVGEIQPLNQDRHEGPIEAVPADIGGPIDLSQPLRALVKYHTQKIPYLIFSLN